MSDVFADLEQLHKEKGHYDVHDNMTVEELRRFLKFRVEFLQEEMREIETAETPEDFLDGIVDWIVVGVGTLEAFRANFNEAWQRVHEANMAKEPGANPSRPNEFRLPDLIKPEGWEPPDLSGLVGELAYMKFPVVEPENIGHKLNLCPKCKTPVSDGAIKRLHEDANRKSIFRCQECQYIFHSKEFPIAESK